LIKILPFNLSILLLDLASLFVSSIYQILFLGTFIYSHNTRQALTKIENKLSDSTAKTTAAKPDIDDKPKKSLCLPVFAPSTISSISTISLKSIESSSHHQLTKTQFESDNNKQNFTTATRRNCKQTIPAYSPSSVSSIITEHSTEECEEMEQNSKNEKITNRFESTRIDGTGTNIEKHYKQIQEMENVLSSLKSSTSIDGSSSKTENEFNLIRPTGDTDTFSEFNEDEIKSVTQLPNYSIPETSNILHEYESTKTKTENENKEKIKEQESSFLQKVASSIIELVMRKSIEKSTEATVKNSSTSTVKTNQQMEPASPKLYQSEVIKNPESLSEAKNENVEDKLKKKTSILDDTARTMTQFALRKSVASYTGNSQTITTAEKDNKIKTKNETVVNQKSTTGQVSTKSGQTTYQAKSSSMYDRKSKRFKGKIGKRKKEFNYYQRTS
jgi:hypothetical protein